MKDCPYKKSCPYLNFESPEKVLAERNYLRGRVDEMEITFNLATERIKLLNKEIDSLKEENSVLKTGAKAEREKIYKPEKKEKKTGKPGAPFGHIGVTREKPKEPDRKVSVHLKHCPHCKGRVKRIYGENSFSDHIQEDIIIIKLVTLFRHYKYWCSKCNRIVQGIGEGEISRSYLGPNAVVISNLAHYDIGIPYEKLKRFYADIFGLPLTTGALIGMDKKVAEKGIPLYTELEKKIKSSSVSYTDETGWPINGENHWLWHAGNKEVSLYTVDKHRSHNVAERILGKNYKGTIISDCYSAYNLIDAGAKQKCIAHILRDIDKISTLYPNDPEVIAFSVNLENILKEGLNLKKSYEKGKCILSDLKKGKEELEKKLASLTRVKITNKKTEALRKRLVRHKNELFTFLILPEVEATNNFAERQLRPSVISRKLSLAGIYKEAFLRNSFSKEEFRRRNECPLAIRQEQEQIDIA